MGALVSNPETAARLAMPAITPDHRCAVSDLETGIRIAAATIIDFPSRRRLPQNLRGAEPLWRNGSGASCLWINS
jgi:hypothetical protein